MIGTDADDDPWWRDEEHCRSLLKWMEDPRVNTLNGARLALGGRCSGPFVTHMATKCDLHLSMYMPRSAWAMLDQVIEGFDLVDPLHPAAVRARISRVIAMCASGYACCAVEEIARWSAVVVSILPQNRKLLGDIIAARLISRWQVNGIDSEALAIARTLHDFLCDPDYLQAKVDELWFGPEGLTEQVTTVVAKPPLAHDHHRSVPIVGAIPPEADEADLLRLAQFQAFQREEVAAVLKTCAVGQSGQVSGRVTPGPTAWSDVRIQSDNAVRCGLCGKGRLALVRVPTECFPSRDNIEDVMAFIEEIATLLGEPLPPGLDA